jgi:hypothetical protein
MKGRDGDGEKRAEEEETAAAANGGAMGRSAREEGAGTRQSRGEEGRRGGRRR